MSKYYQGYLGAQIGKLGNAVGRMWKGRAVMAVYQPNIADARTEPQLLIRSRFRVINQLSSALLEAIYVGMGYIAKQYRLTEGNVFVKRNWPNVTAVSPDEVSISYSALTIASGTLPEAVFGAVDFGTTQHLKIEAAMSSTADLPGANENDQVYIVAYCPEYKQAVLGTPVPRSNDKVSVNVPSQWDGMEVHVWGFAVSALTSKKKRCSATAYLGTGEVA